MARFDQVEDSSWSSHSDVWRLVLQDVSLRWEWITSQEKFASEPVNVSAESFKLLVDLEGELTGVCQHETLKGIGLLHIKLVEDRNHKDCSLTHSGLGLTDKVFSQNADWNGFLLY